MYFSLLCLHLCKTIQLSAKGPIFLIFNRWGNIITQIKEVSSKGWDGTDNGKTNDASKRYMFGNWTTPMYLTLKQRAGRCRYVD
jgi:gliding motility-associated-like protein